MASFSELHRAARSGRNLPAADRFRQLLLSMAVLSAFAASSANAAPTYMYRVPLQGLVISGPSNSPDPGAGGWYRGRQALRHARGRPFWAARERINSQLGIDIAYPPPTDRQFRAQLLAGRLARHCPGVSIQDFGGMGGTPM
jgi:hypothetical protein